MNNNVNVGLVQMEVRKVVTNHQLKDGLFSKLEEHRLDYYATQYRSIMNSAQSTTLEKVQAAQELLAVEGFQKLFKMMHDLGLDTSGMTGGDIIHQTLQEKLQGTRPRMADVMSQKMSIGTNKAVTGTKKGLNKFGSWLASKTQ